jgi:hypothetical protein
MIISSKLHSSTNYLTSSRFSAFNRDDVSLFERNIVMRTGSRMSTLASPSYFLENIISLCSEKVDKEHLSRMVNGMIGEFWEG